jgi:hypothetical protein
MWHLETKGWTYKNIYKVSRLILVEMIEEQVELLMVILLCMCKYCK